MLEHKKTIPAGDAAEMVQGDRKMTVESNSCQTDCTTDRSNRQCIFDLLPQGEGSAIPSKTLVEMTGSRSVRDLQNKIAMEREQGRLILSTCKNGGGYYRPAEGPEGQAEIAAFVGTLTNRAINTLKVLKTAQAALKEVTGQLDLLVDVEAEVGRGEIGKA